MPDKRDDEAVGYKKPPRRTQFRKGQSGNPKGRPRKQRADPVVIEDSMADAILRAELEREITVSDSKGARMMPMIRIITRAQINAAAKGNVQAQRDVLRQARELEARDDARRVQQEEKRRETFEKIAHLKERRAQAWAAAQQSDAASAGPWPHPDDILLDESTLNWRIRGPWSERDVPFFEYARAQRDLAFIRSVIAARTRKIRSAMRYGWDIWICWDVRLPKRWQLDGDTHAAALAVLLALPLRLLRKAETERAARVETLRPVTLSQAQGRSFYREVDIALKPFFKKHGYRSLADV